ncbi:MAG: RagB/SusD family nutrient uptake outer membrane protein [Bacteroidales bacterium]|nr:RagB/SusD family nutrient uptake outer membrane protein [Bacteroidales bacterium]
MKKSFRYLLIAVATTALVLPSCDLNLTPTTSIAYIEGDPVMLTDTDVSEFENGILASYRGTLYGVYSQTMEVACDGFNASIDYGNNYGAMHRLDDSFNDGEYNTRDNWSGHYGAIKNYNILIANADNVSDDLKDYAQFVKGEALFCRASSYLHLARHFAKPYGSTSSSDPCFPLVTVYDQLEKPARATVAEVYAQVKSDLDQAAAILASESGEAGADYPTIDAVNAIYARYYLDIKDYANAARYAEAVINTGNYKLASTDEEMDAEYLNDSGSEPIIQMYASKSEGYGTNDIYTLTNNDATQGLNFRSYYFPTKKLVEAYDEGDLRFTHWFSNQIPNFVSGSYHKGEFYTFIKYYNNPALNSGNVPQARHARKPILIGEMYLIAAEAYAQAGNSAKATEILNELQAARKATLTEGTMDNIKNEWFKETVGEGLRLSCIKRWGDGIGVRTPQDGTKLLIMQGTAYDQRTVSAGADRLTWPVPTYELQVNPNLVQNPGF